MRTFTLVVIFCCSTLFLRAQKPTVEMYVQQVSKGWTTDAKKALPDLLIDHPDDAGVMFLHASLVADPERAMPLFDRIVKNYPTNEWADDAILRMILHACLKNDAAKAKSLFVSMRESYASSSLLPVAHDALRMSVGTPPPANVTESKPAPPATKVEATPAPTKKSAHIYTLNTKIVPSKKDATAMLDTFKKKRMRAKLTEKWVKGKRNYVVQVGEYDTEVDAARDIDLVRSICNCKPTVVRRD